MNLTAPAQAFTFRARPVRIIDGDTMDVLIDQGMHCQRLERLRLLGINCPEKRGETRDKGIEATAWVIRWTQKLSGEWPLTIQTEKDDAFGRYLAHIWCRETGEYLNGAIMAAGHAVVYRD